MDPLHSPPRPAYKKMSKQPSQRLPAPSLFVGPPSHNASNTSLSKPTSNTSQTSKNVPSAAIPGPSSPSLPQHNSSTTIPLSRQNTNTNNTTRNLPSSAHQNPGDGTGVGENADVGMRKTRPRRGTAVLDAHWAALQSTLSDIELSAGSSAHVFGEGHAKALEELRAAQVELARAWGQTDVEDNTSDTLSHTTTNDSDKKDASSAHEKKGDKGETKTEGKGTGERKLSNSPGDLSDAAKRRDASDKYFLRVKDGVQEVVRKLDAVSAAMRAVEMQSRDIWGETESATTDTMSTLSN